MDAIIAKICLLIRRALIVYIVSLLASLLITALATYGFESAGIKDICYGVVYYLLLFGMWAWTFSIVFIASVSILFAIQKKPVWQTFHKEMVLMAGMMVATLLCYACSRLFV